MSAQARIRKDRIAKDCAALGVLHTRLTGVREMPDTEEHRDRPNSYLC
jgi:hypothetical protein